MLNEGGSFIEWVGQVLNPLLTFLIGIVVAFWKVAGMFNKISLVEQRQTQLDEELKEVKQNILRTEQILSAQLDRINTKLDHVIMDRED